MRRRTILGLAAALAVVQLLAVDVSAQQDITGVWTVALEFADAKAEVLATVKQTGEKLQMTLTGPTGNFELAGTMVKDELSVNHTMEIQGATGQIKMSGTLVDDRIIGTLDFLGRGQLKWTAVRKREGTETGAPALAPAPAPSPVGTPAPASEPVAAPAPEPQPRQE
jgi:hypothetical protein